MKQNITIITLSIMLILLTASAVSLFYYNPNPQPAIMGGLEIPTKPEIIIKVDTLFNDTDYAGDTACFEYINNHKIQLRCVCSCGEYIKKINKN